MKLSSGVEWCVHICLLLTEAADRPVGRRQLAAHFGLPEAYLAKYLKKMAAAGILEATSGPRGGFLLARPADQITVADVVDATEGTAPVFTCTEIRLRGAGAAPASECVRDCLVKTVMGDAERAWRASLESRSIAEMASRLDASTLQRYRDTAQGA